jgi:hypothetical protein
MRPKITIRSAKIDRFVYVQVSDDNSRIGILEFTMPVYKAFIQTLMQGSLDIGDAGCEIVLVEEFNRLSENKEKEKVPA